jgi:hypothetical protein
MWMPMRQPASVGVTEKASSISVVAASSMEKARTRPGQIAGLDGSSTGGKPVPAGKYSNRKRSKCSSWEDARAPQSSNRRAGDCPFGAGGFEGLGFEAVAVGLVEQLADQGLELFGQVPARSSSRMRSMAAACWRFFSRPARAAWRISAGALRKRPRPLRWK